MQHPLVALALLAVVGAGGIVFHVLAMTTLQRVLPRGVLGRVTGLRSSVTFAAMLLGSLAAPALVTWVGPQLTFLFCGLLLVGAAVAALPRMAVLSAAAEKRRLELLPLVRLLEGLRIFEGAPRPTLEALAGELERQPVDAGRDVVRQGEPADHLYVIESGRFVVLVDGGEEVGLRSVSTLGPGDYFGEIGLLRGIPRIATVRAVDNGVVQRLDGWRFLTDVVEGIDLSPGARQSIDARITQTAGMRVD